jgi:tetratricopeptide (TPR) repeat protein
MSTSIIPAAWIDNDKTDEKERTHNKLDGNYLWSRLFIEALVRLESKYMIGALDDCINLCHELYIGNDVQCTKISTFKETYKPSDAVWWYTKEKFIYELLNKALRIQDIDTVFTFRFLIYDICEQLDNEQVNNFLKLAEEPVELASKKIVNSWRGQQMSVEEFEKLRHSEGQYISINSFFSTSKDKQVALIFSESIDNKISVLFEIESDICSVVSRPFADVTNLSLFFYEEEILFMTSAVFKIMSVHYDDEIDHIWIIKLILCDERDTQLNKILRELIDEILPRKTNFMSIGHVLMRMGLHDKAEQFYQRHLKTLPSDDKASFIQAYMNLTVLAEAKEDHHLAISHWKTVIDMTMNQFPTVHNSMQEILYSVNNCLARTIQQSDYDKMFQFIQKSHLERLATVGHDHLETANSYALFSYISRVQGKLDEALKNLNIGLEIALKVLTENHPRLGELYEAIGDLHASKKDYNLALLSYKKALLIKSTSLPNYHADITKLRDTIAAIHEQHIEN